MRAVAVMALGLADAVCETTEGVAVRHRGLGQPHLGFRQRELPAAEASARPRGREPGQGAFADQLPLELGQRREDTEHEAAGRGGGVDLRALPGEHPQAHAAGRQVLHGVDQVGEVAAEAVELPDDEHVARPERAHTAVESRAVVADAGREVVVDVDGADASGLQRVALQVQRLGTVCLRDAGVADQHVSQTAVCDTPARAPAGARRRVSYPVSFSRFCRRHVKESGTENRSDKAGRGRPYLPSRNARRTCCATTAKPRATWR